MSGRWLDELGGRRDFSLFSPRASSAALSFVLSPHYTHPRHPFAPVSHIAALARHQLVLFPSSLTHNLRKRSFGNVELFGLNLARCEREESLRRRCSLCRGGPSPLALSRSRSPRSFDLPTMVDYSIASLAYLKLVLHAAKFPSSTCVGLLIGTVAGSSCTITDAVPLLHHWTNLSPMAEAGLGLVSPARCFVVEERSSQPTWPSLEQAELYAKQQQLVFLGLYVANERLGNQAVPNGAQKMAEAIRRDRPEAVVLVVRLRPILSALFLSCTDADLVRRSTTRSWRQTSRPSLCVLSPISSLFPSDHCLRPQPYLPPKSPSAAWQPTTLSSARISLADSSAPTKALEQVRQGRHKLLGDFDEHLEDVRVDWLRNAAVSV